MFEKEAEEIMMQKVIKENDCIMTPCKTLEDCQLYDFCFDDMVDAFKDGAEFGYNKANEWHYVKDGDYPKEYKDLWICFITEEDMKDYVRGWYEYDLDEDEHYFKTVNIFGTAVIKNVYAWQTLVPPKERE